MSALREPLVTVVLSAHNAQATILDAIRSINAQTYPSWEAVLCDDASSDRTRVIAEAALEGNAARWRIHTLPHGGPAAARNYGVAQARGEFVAFLDDDDLWEKDKLSRCVAAMVADTLDVVCHSEAWRGTDGASAIHHYSSLFDARVHPVVSLMRNNPFSTSALVVRRETLLAAGPFDTAMPSAEDYDMWIRIALVPGVRIGFIDEPLGTYTLRQGSESSKVARRMHAMLMIGERYSSVLASFSSRGRLEVWIFRAKVYFTSGLRFLMSGSALRGGMLIITGLAMWPFRVDWAREGMRRLVARVARPMPGRRGVS